MKRSTRVFKVGAVVLLFCMVLLYLYPPRSTGMYRSNIPVMGLNFVSQGMCSCLWVSEHPYDFCVDYARVDQVSPIIEVDEAKKEVTTRLFWIFHSTTKFINEHQGCRTL